MTPISRLNNAGSFSLVCLTNLFEGPFTLFPDKYPNDWEVRRLGHFFPNSKHAYKYKYRQERKGDTCIFGRSKKWGIFFKVKSLMPHILSNKHEDLRDKENQVLCGKNFRKTLPISWWWRKWLALESCIHFLLRKDASGQFSKTLLTAMGYK